MMETCSILIGMIATWVHPFVKSHQAVHLESVHLLYINCTSVMKRSVCYSLSQGDILLSALHDLTHLLLTKNMRGEIGLFAFYRWGK